MKIEIKLPVLIFSVFLIGAGYFNWFYLQKKYYHIAHPFMNQAERHAWAREVAEEMLERQRNESKEDREARQRALDKELEEKLKEAGIDLNDYKLADDADQQIQNTAPKEELENDLDEFEIDRSEQQEVVKQIEKNNQIRQNRTPKERKKRNPLGLDYDHMGDDDLVKEFHRQYDRNPRIDPSLESLMIKRGLMDETGILLVREELAETGGLFTEGGGKGNGGIRNSETLEASQKTEDDKMKSDIGGLFGEGDPNAANLEGISSGSGRAGRGLGSRGLLKSPTVTANTQKAGTLVVYACVDASGKVISAEYTQRGSTTADRQLVEAAIQNAKEWEFSIGSVDKQCGTITYNFKVR